jgi:hypothetical protein
VTFPAPIGVLTQQMPSTRPLNERARTAIDGRSGGCPRASMSLASVVLVSATDGRDFHTRRFWPSYCQPDRRDWQFAPLKLQNRIDFLPNRRDESRRRQRGLEGSPIANKGGRAEFPFKLFGVMELNFSARVSECRQCGRVWRTGNLFAYD